MVHNDVIPAKKNNTAKSCVFLFLTVGEGLVLGTTDLKGIITCRSTRAIEGNEGDTKQEECSETVCFP